MSGGIIPSWNSQGVLPPIDPSKPTSRSRSPYKVSSNDLVLQFGTSSYRQNLLDGLLSFRSELHGVGLVAGFQWLDGSFLECTESLRSCPPNDIDVVTFFYLPANQTQKKLLKGYPQLFDHGHIKNNYHMDAYFFELEGNVPEILVSESTYWYSLWSHQRNSLLWKGYLQIDLSPTDDHIALDILNRIKKQGGAP